MMFPLNRMRRLRRTAALRSLVRETRLSPESLVCPLFVCPGEGVRKEVRSMPGVFNLSVDEAVKDGFQGLCATGDMRWELGADENFDRLLEYEALLERVFR